ncbi:hypothetical protein ACFFMN_00090 [Planobispora siamensis]|uniref:hypothetical protein n=1 Tax=Planobispora siamensis TaxID=936338 RepID=UPI00194DEE20|nr:hypothetical protein [Planobispora siamensis]
MKDEEWENQELENQLRRAAEIFDPLPSGALQSAIDAYALHTLEAELAELAFDSLERAAGVRGPGRPRLLTFRSPPVTIELEISVSGGTGHIIGRLLPPQPARIEIHGRRPMVLTADPLGRFSGEHLPTGAFSLRCRLPSLVVATEWITI